ncbi:protamine P1 domain containing protein [Herbaspirillum rhizosphaerae]|uniref:Protamine P1 domain containing protein n=1 Tax=Herbaspirillum rhizosphaerae TaxID=346179 RepID=A0ABW8ZDT0_9BURK
MSVSSVSSSYTNALYDNVYVPVKNAVAKVGDEIGDVVDATVDTVKSAAHTVADDVSAGWKSIGNIIDTSA